MTHYWQVTGFFNKDDNIQIQMEAEEQDDQLLYREVGDRKSETVTASSKFSGPTATSPSSFAPSSLQ